MFTNLDLRFRVEKVLDQAGQIEDHFQSQVHKIKSNEIWYALVLYDVISNTVS